MFSEALDAYLDARATPLEPLLQENYEETYASLSSPQNLILKGLCDEAIGADSGASRPPVPI